MTTTTATTTRRKQTTARIGGRKVRVVTTSSGTKVTEAPTEEWILQSAAVKRLHAMPGYGTQFLIAGDMNAARRSKQESVKAKATGIAAGDPDLRVYGAGGRLLLIEYKNAEGTLTASQKQRHPLLAALGHPVTVLRCATPAECADRTEALVRGWLAEGEAVNDNNSEKAKKIA